MASIVGFAYHYIFWFLIVLTVLVFVHELGHYLVARWNGVRVEVFSIGFGPELFGWNNRAGTRWKISAVPLGGYVKMFGDADPASMPSTADLREMTPQEREVAFHHKRLSQRAAVVAAGPLANFVFAIVALAVLFVTVGQPSTPPEIGSVQAGSAAEGSGMQAGDTIIAIDGQAITRFEDVQRIVRLDPGQPLSIVVHRGDRDVTLSVTPKLGEVTDRFGNKHQYGMLGIVGQGTQYVRYGPVAAVGHAFAATADTISMTMQGVWQMIIGARGTDDLGGPLRIAQISGEISTVGLAAVLDLMAVLSINLGLINLFPIPVLDGGHLLFYAAEAVRGRPLGQRAQEYGFRLGLALVLTLMVFATWNDLVHLRVVEFLKALVT